MNEQRHPTAAEEYLLRNRGEVVSLIFHAVLDAGPSGLDKYEVRRRVRPNVRPKAMGSVTRTLERMIAEGTLIRLRGGRLYVDRFDPS